MDAYEELQLVGRGAFASVRLCRRRKDNRLFVVKKFTVPLDDLTAAGRTELAQEVKLLAHLKHPGIVDFEDFYIDNESMANLIMEYCEGGTLHAALQNRHGNFLSEDRVWEAFVQIADALKFVHSQNVLHRDMKSSNILLSGPGPDFRVMKLGDFGIAKVLGGASELAATIVGTPFYLSPEVAEGRQYDSKSDIWALGVVLFELMALHRPFEASNLPAVIFSIIKGIPPPLPTVFSADLRALANKLMARKPEDRPTLREVMAMPVVAQRLEAWKKRKASLVSHAGHRSEHMQKAHARRSPVEGSVRGLSQPVAQSTDEQGSLGVGSSHHADRDADSSGLHSGPQHQQRQHSMPGTGKSSAPAFGSIYSLSGMLAMPSWMGKVRGIDSDLSKTSASVQSAQSQGARMGSAGPSLPAGTALPAHSLGSFIPAPSMSASGSKSGEKSGDASQSRPTLSYAHEHGSTPGSGSMSTTRSNGRAGQSGASHLYSSHYRVAVAGTGNDGAASDSEDAEAAREKTRAENVENWLQVRLEDVYAILGRYQWRVMCVRAAECSDPYATASQIPLTVDLPLPLPGRDEEWEAMLGSEPGRSRAAYVSLLQRVPPLHAAVFVARTELMVLHIAIQEEDAQAKVEAGGGGRGRVPGLLWETLGRAWSGLYAWHMGVLCLRRAIRMRHNLSPATLHVPEVLAHMLVQSAILACTAAEEGNTEVALTIARTATREPARAAQSVRLRRESTSELTSPGATCESKGSNAGDHGFTCAPPLSPLPTVLEAVCDVVIPPADVDSCAVCIPTPYKSESDMAANGWRPLAVQLMKDGIALIKRLVGLGATSERHLLAAEMLRLRAWSQLQPPDVSIDEDLEASAKMSMLAHEADAEREPSSPSCANLLTATMTQAVVCSGNDRDVSRLKAQAREAEHWTEVRKSLLPSDISRWVAVVDARFVRLILGDLADEDASSDGGSYHDAESTATSTFSSHQQKKKETKPLLTPELIAKEYRAELSIGAGDMMRQATMGDIQWVIDVTATRLQLLRELLGSSGSRTIQTGDSTSETVSPDSEISPEASLLVGINLDMSQGERLWTVSSKGRAHLARKSIAWLVGVHNRAEEVLVAMLDMFAAAKQSVSVDSVAATKARRPPATAFYSERMGAAGVAVAPTSAAAPSSQAEQCSVSQAEPIVPRALLAQVFSLPSIPEERMRAKLSPPDGGSVTPFTKTPTVSTSHVTPSAAADSAISTTDKSMQLALHLSSASSSIDRPAIAIHASPLGAEINAEIQEAFLPQRPKQVVSSIDTSVQEGLLGQVGRSGLVAPFTEPVNTSLNPFARSTPHSMRFSPSQWKREREHGVDSSNVPSQPALRDTTPSGGEGAQPELPQNAMDSQPPVCGKSVAALSSVAPAVQLPALHTIRPPQAAEAPVPTAQAAAGGERPSVRARLRGWFHCHDKNAPGPTGLPLER